MENVILILVRALAVLGEKGIHWLLNAIKQSALKSPNKVDDELFEKVLSAIKSFDSKNA